MIHIQVSETESNFKVVEVTDTTLGSRSIDQNMRQGFHGIGMFLRSSPSLPDVHTDEEV